MAQIELPVKKRRKKNMDKEESLEVISEQLTRIADTLDEIKDDLHTRPI